MWLLIHTNTSKCDCTPKTLLGESIINVMYSYITLTIYIYIYIYIYIHVCVCVYAVD